MHTLILGGARSGKSALAERLATERGRDITLIVTAEVRDAEMAERVARHRAERPAHWRCVEAPRALAAALHAERDRCVIIDCLTLWLTNLLLDDDPRTLAVERDALLDAVARHPGPLLLVSNEVGLGIVPDNPLARRFRDEAGRLHQALAARCDEAVFVAAGQPLILKDPAATPNAARAPIATTPGHMVGFAANSAATPAPSRDTPQTTAHAGRPAAPAAAAHQRGGLEDVEPRAAMGDDALDSARLAEHEAGAAAAIAGSVLPRSSRTAGTAGFTSGGEAFELDATALGAARDRQNRLTKPRGALGELEAVAIRLAGIQRCECPAIRQPWISVFAADHGVVDEGVSAFPQAVTGQMIHNFLDGGAAISVLARELGARLEVIDVGIVQQLDERPGLRRERAGAGTANFTREAAMRPEQLQQALASGRNAVTRARAAGADLFIGGEMGIGNTTAASALTCALLDAAPETLVGPGTGLDAYGVQHKIDVVRRALAAHAGHLDAPREALRRVGGFEIAALTGAYLACAEQRMPAVIDGVIAGVAALVAQRLQPGASAFWLFGHRSAEPAHATILAALDARALLDLGMRLGEGSGAAAAVSLIRLACALHAGMATFDAAGVADTQ